MESTSRERANVQTSRGNTLASLLTFVQADGNVLLSVFCMKAKFDETGESDVNFTLHKYDKKLRRSWPRYFCWTDKGFFDTFTFAHVIDKVIETWTQQHPGLNLMLLGDQLAGHRDNSILEKALARKVFMWSFAANTSHFLQPLDDVLFANFKNHALIRGEQAVIDAEFLDLKKTDLLLVAAFEAELKAFTRKQIIAAFLNTGVCPFNRDKIVALAKLNLGVQEPDHTLGDICRQATQEVIDSIKERVATDIESHCTGVARVKRGQIHNPEELLAFDRERRSREAKEKEEKEARAIEREAKRQKKEDDLKEADQRREAKTCRAGCGKVSRGGKQWFECSCLKFYVCPTCKKKSDGIGLMATHLSSCVQPGSPENQE